MIRETLLELDGRRAHVYEGGSGEHLVLVHGGWGGASTHWRSVWDELAKRFHVVAPDLPGIGDTSRPGLGTIGAYARFLRDVLDAIDVPRAWLVGNSFGVSVIARFAIEFPERCLGLVFVNGIPLPRTPWILRRLGERRLGRNIMRFVERRVAYTERAIDLAFVDKAKVPHEIRALVHDGAAAQVDAISDVLVHGGSRRASPIAPLLLWGEDDHLPGSGRRTAEKLEAAWRDARLVYVPHAGHMPQVENPGAFVDQLVGLVGAG